MAHRERSRATGRSSGGFAGGSIDGSARTGGGDGYGGSGGESVLGFKGILFLLDPESVPRVVSLSFLEFDLSDRIKIRRNRAHCTGRTQSWRTICLRSLGTSHQAATMFIHRYRHSAKPAVSAASRGNGLPRSSPIQGSCSLAGGRFILTVRSSEPRALESSDARWQRSCQGMVPNVASRSSLSDCRQRLPECVSQTGRSSVQDDRLRCRFGSQQPGHR